MDINPLSDISLVNMFSHSGDYLFILLMISFAVQKHFSLMWFYLFNISFVSLAWGYISENILLWEIFVILLLMFSFRIFMVLNLTIKYFIIYISLGKGNKRKNKQMGLHQTKKFLHSKGNHQQNKKTPHRMGEHIWQYIWSGVKIQNL